MKKGHASLFFWIVVCYCFLSLVVEQKRYQAVEHEKERVEESLLYAMNMAALDLTLAIGESDEVKRYTLEESFFRALYIRMGVAGNEEEQKKIKIHIPLLAFLSEEGGYFYCAKENIRGSESPLEHTWSGLEPYPISESESINRTSLKVYLEEKVSYIISRHNYIAEQYGIEYEFSVPYFMADSEEVTLPMLIVVFQGWPLTGSGEYYYENCLDAVAYIKEAD